MKRYWIHAAAIGTFFTVCAKNYCIGPDDGLNAIIKSLLPGDTLFINPGIYSVMPSDISMKTEPGPYAVVYDLSVSGEKDRPIVIKGIQGEDGMRPVFDFSKVTLCDDGNPEGYRITGFLISGSYLHISDFECTGIQVTRTDHTQSENFRINGGSYNTIENISCHDGMGIGVYINGDSHHNLVVNCDAYNNYDPISDISKRTGEGSGGNNDGFGCHVKGGMDGNVFIGCRAWRNSDDGFDLINCYSPVTVSHCIAIENGFDSEKKDRADGNGIKGGGFGMRSRNIPLHNHEAPRHTVSDNVAVGNKANGIYSNHHLGGIDFISNTSIENGKFNYSMVNRKGPGENMNIDVNGYGHFLSANISNSLMGRHTVWMESLPADDEILCLETPKEIDVQSLLVPRYANGMLSDQTILNIDSLTENENGADFSKYSDLIERTRQIAGAEAK